MDDIDFKNVDYVSLEVLLQGKSEPPQGITVNAEKTGFDAPHVDNGELYSFAVRVVTGIPKMPGVETSPQVGHYLVALPKMRDPLFADSIILLTGYWPLLEHVQGKAIVEHHPTLNFTPGWDVNQLYQEMVGYGGMVPPSWNVMDQEEMEKYVAEKNITLIPEHRSLMLYDLKELNKSILN